MNLCATTLCPTLSAINTSQRKDCETVRAARLRFPQAPSHCLWPTRAHNPASVLVYILSQQETQYLLWTGGIMATATVYWVLYLRPRQDTRWLVTLPQDMRP